MKITWYFMQFLKRANFLAFSGVIAYEKGHDFGFSAPTMA